MLCSVSPMQPLRQHLRRARLFSSPPRLASRLCSKMAREDAELGELLEYLERLKNHEKLGVPTGAGTESKEGFDLGRMRRLLQRLGDPHLDFKAVHIAGTKGKGSTAAFISNTLREEGYAVGSYTSPHLLSICERIALGNGEPVTARTLKKLFLELKSILDKAIESENGTLTHFEVFTALAFSLFSKTKVDFAVVEAGLGGARDATNVLTSMGLCAAVITTIGEEHLAALGGSLESIAIAKAGIIKQGRPLVIGGPFQNHIELILRQKAFLMDAHVVSACDPGIRSLIKCFGEQDGRPYQSCDISVKTLDGLPQSIELLNAKLSMLGEHQLQNAVTAVCTSLCLRNQGWSISDKSIHAALEKTVLPGRAQFLSGIEIRALGLSGVSVLLDSAHTGESAKSVVNIVRKMYRQNHLAFVVAMASDKDHLSFCRQLLSGLQPDVFLLTEVSIAGSTHRTTPAFSLKDSCLHAASDLGIDTQDLGMITCNQVAARSFLPKKAVTVVGCENKRVVDLLNTANQLLRCRSENNDGLIVVTGSFHIVSSVLSAIYK